LSAIPAIQLAGWGRYRKLGLARRVGGYVARCRAAALPSGWVTIEGLVLTRLA
jgi:hypothetical protein